MRLGLLCLMAVLMSRSIAAADMTVEEILELQQSVQAFEQRVQEMTERREQEEVFREAQQAIRDHHAAQSTLLQEGATSEHAVRVRLGDILESTIGAEAAQQIEAEVFFPSQRLDPKDIDTLATGSEGILWAFWSRDAPGVGTLANLLNTVEREVPGLRVADVHIMPWSVWKQELAGLDEVRKMLEHRDPLVNDEAEVREKKALFDALYSEWQGFTDMAHSRRRGGILMFEDATPAVILGIEQLPSFAYVDPTHGNIHVLRGIRPGMQLSAWVQHCRQWERDNAEVIRMRLGQ